MFLLSDVRRLGEQLISALLRLRHPAREESSESFCLENLELSSRKTSTMIAVKIMDFLRSMILFILPSWVAEILINRSPDPSYEDSISTSENSSTTAEPRNTYKRASSVTFDRLLLNQPSINSQTSSPRPAAPDNDGSTHKRYSRTQSTDGKSEEESR